MSRNDGEAGHAHITAHDSHYRVEPDLLDNVLDDLKRVLKRCGMFTIATGPARRILPDGRNAHLIQQPPSWWLPKLMQRFDLVLFNRVPRGFLVIVERAANPQTRA